MNDQLPLMSVVVEPRTIFVIVFLISTDELGSAVPLIVGVVSFVDEPLVGDVINGTAGAMVSMVTFAGFDEALTFPKLSVAVAVIG